MEWTKIITTYKTNKNYLITYMTKGMKDTIVIHNTKTMETNFIPLKNHQTNGAHDSKRIEAQVNELLTLIGNTEKIKLSEPVYHRKEQKIIPNWIH